MDVAFCPSGLRALTASVDHTARFWDVRSRKPIGKPLRHNEWVGTACFSPNGAIALTASADSTLQFWDVSTQRPLGMPLRHEACVFSAVFRPDGNEVLSGSLDGTARFWPVPVAVEGEIERVVLWAQVVTGAELGEGDVVHVLDAPTWKDRRKRLLELGGPPAPSGGRLPDH